MSTYLVISDIPITDWFFREVEEVKKTKPVEDEIPEAEAKENVKNGDEKTEENGDEKEAETEEKTEGEE